MARFNVFVLCLNVFFLESQASNYWWKGRQQHYNNDYSTGRTNDHYNRGESYPEYYHNTESDQYYSEYPAYNGIYDYHDQEKQMFNHGTKINRHKKGGAKRPHIVLIVADDLGWNDVSWNNEEFRKVTPNLGRLAEEGVILDSFYAQPSCTPTRASFRLGLYPFKTGFQSGGLRNERAAGINSSFTTLPEKMRNLGYNTNLIGKWHIGFCKLSFTPTKLGYNSFYGFYTGRLTDFFAKINVQPGSPEVGELRGFDFRDNTGVVQDNTTYAEILLRRRAVETIENLPKDQLLFLEYSSNLPHGPLQVPSEDENRFPFIEDDNRRIYAAMVSILDDSVGDIVNALKQRGIWEETIIVFMSDNGGNERLGASNGPLRDDKGSLYEGGVRVPAFVHSNFIKRKGRRSQGLVHAVDWLNTFVHVSGGITDSTLDSLNVWDMISKGAPSPRTEIIHNIDQLGPARSIRSGDYKLVSMDPFGTTIGENTELFNIRVDPFETNNLVEEETQVALRLLKKLSEQQKFLVPSVREVPRMYEEANPANFGGVWSPGWC